MSRAKIFGTLTLLSLSLFVFFTFLVKKRSLVPFDFDTTVRLQNHIPTRLDVFFSFFSLLGSFEVFTIVLVLLFVVTRKLAGIAILAFFAVAHVIELAGKIFLTHPGPPFMFFRYDLGFFFPSTYVQTGSSYPSGHSMRTVFVGMLFFYLILTSRKMSPVVKTMLGLAIVLFVGVMLVSRVSLGEHWTTDVVGGSLLGAAFAFLSFPLLDKKISIGGMVSRRAQKRSSG